MLGCLSKNRKMIVPILKNSNMQNRQLQPQLTNYDYVGYSQNPNYYFVPIIYTNQRMWSNLNYLLLFKLIIDYY